MDADIVFTKLAHLGAVLDRPKLDINTFDVAEGSSDMTPIPLLPRVTFLSHHPMLSFTQPSEIEFLGMAAREI